MIDLLTLIPGKKKYTTSGWYSLNAVCCHHKGHRQDKRGRGGIKIEGETQIYNCFNCGYACSLVIGKSISNKTRQLLKWCGYDETQIQKFNLESLQNKDLLEYVRVKKERMLLKLKEYKLPDEAIKIDSKDITHKKYVDYLASRNLTTHDYSFYITPNDVGRNNNRILIPYTYKGKIVGQTSRYLDDRTPKYINEHPSGFVFGMDFQKSDYEFVLVVEGIFDAISIGACAVMHNTISEDQSLLIGSLNKRVIYVPDFDKPGFDAIDRALDLGYYVSLPKWDTGVKDVNDAVVKYGKLATLLSIVQTASNSKIKIQMQRRKIEKVF